MAKSIALIVAGTGETSAKEVFDLIEDYVSDYGEIDLIVPVDKDLFSGAVQHAVEWYDDDKHVIGVQTTGAPLSRASSKLGSDKPEEVAAFADIFEDGFDDFDVVEFFIALPESDADDFDDHVALVEAAAAKDIAVKNLCRGLDDVVIEDEPEPDPEPEPEPEKPKRASRSRKKAEPEPEAEPAADLQEEVAAAVAEKKSKATVAKGTNEVIIPKDVTEALVALKDAERVLRHWTEAAALITGEEPKYVLAVRLDKAYNTLTAALSGPGEPATTKVDEESAQEAAEPAETKKRGRGRPRENFEEKQIWDDEEDEWVKPGRGRLAKGTKWRTVDTRDDSVVDEGVV